MSFYVAMCLSILASIPFSDPMDKFSWLTGTWEMKKADGSVRLEIWSRTDTHSFTGKGVKVIGQDTFHLENLELAYQDGHYRYIAIVPDQNDSRPVPFQLKAHDGPEFIFENPGHDFPQRIIYHFKPAAQGSGDVNEGDTLLIRIESLDGITGINFNFRRK